MSVSKAVLIVDDDSRNIFALSAVLKAKGYEVMAATGAAEGLSILRSNQNVGVVLMDMMMPEMDGYEAIGEIRSDEDLSGLPIIAVTAQAMLGDREKAIDAGANNYVSKPIDVDVLLDLLKDYIR